MSFSNNLKFGLLKLTDLKGTSPIFACFGNVLHHTDISAGKPLAFTAANVATKSTTWMSLYFKKGFDFELKGILSFALRFLNLLEPF